MCTLIFKWKKKNHRMDIAPNNLLQSFEKKKETPRGKKHAMQYQTKKKLCPCHPKNDLTHFMVYLVKLGHHKLHFGFCINGVVFCLLFVCSFILRSKKCRWLENRSKHLKTRPFGVEFVNSSFFLHGWNEVIDSLCNLIFDDFPHANRSLCPPRKLTSAYRQFISCQMSN